MGLGTKPAALDLDIRTGDRWRYSFRFTDGGDHNQDGVIEDPNNPTALNMSTYTFTAQIRVSKNDVTTPVAVGIPVAFTVDATNAATGVIVLSLSPTQTTALLLPAENRTTKQLVWDMQRVKTADATDVLSLYEGAVNVTLDVTR